VGRVVAGVVLGLVAVGWPVAAVVWSQGAHEHLGRPVAVPSASVSEPAGVLGWTVAQAKAAVAGGEVSRVVGAPARVDEGRLRAALAGSGKRVLLLPYSGVETRERYEKQVDTLAGSDHGKLIVVEGLDVSVPGTGTVVGPSDLAEVSYVLGTGDVTGMVLAAIDGRSHDAVPDRTARAADPATVDAVAAGLAARGVYTAPGLPTVGHRGGWRDLVPGRTVRLAVLPAAAPGRLPPDLATPLGARFPGDLVVVVQGLWVQLAGPGADLRRTAIDGYYGDYFDQTAEWGPPRANLGLLLAEKYGQLAANRAVVEHPERDPDPLPFVIGWLPWVFTGTVVAVVAGSLVVRWRLAVRRHRRTAAERGRRGRLAARLTAVAADLTRLDGLAREGTARDLVDGAAERYAVARDLVTSGGDPATAERATADAAAALDRAAHLLHVPGLGLPGEEEGW
jgi:hypothetical protein